MSLLKFYKYIPGFIFLRKQAIKKHNFYKESLPSETVPLRQNKISV